MIFKFLSKNFYISFSIVALIYFLDRLSKMYIIQLDKKLSDFSQNIDFSELCITSSAEVSYLENSDTKVQTTKAEGSKCQVCWKITKDACSRKACPQHTE